MVQGTGKVLLGACQREEERIGQHCYASWRFPSVHPVAVWDQVILFGGGYYRHCRWLVAPLASTH